MFGLGLWELLLILAVVLLLFGANKLPQLGAGLGQGIKSFQKAFRSVQEPGDEKQTPPQAPPSSRPPRD